MMRMGSPHSSLKMQAGTVRVLGRFEGRGRSEVFSEALRGIFSFAIHYSLNGQIYVDGDTVRGERNVCYEFRLKCTHTWSSS